MKYRKILFFIIIMWMTISPTTLLANESLESVANSATPDIAELQENSNLKLPPPPVGESTEVGWLSSFEYWISFSVLVFGLMVFGVEFAVIRTINFGPEQSIKLIAVTLIVISTLFIITAGFDSEQIAPAMGLFGTIAGYMLGRASNKEKGENE